MPTIIVPAEEKREVVCAAVWELLETNVTEIKERMVATEKWTRIH